ncbi:hypothetical protein CC2G_010847 [Coprinopsis cinerea AmutBmut pab1-1]|nr:hypothetical protein CC2G_010847 [Coprinopsis cinerea AmutBmut pab1-1]
MHQESTFQQAVVRNVNDKNAQLQRQLENVIREANSEIELLVNKRNELERDLELERKKVRELQDSNREQNKEYQKLKAHYDKMKKKMLLGGPQPNDTTIPTTSQGSGLIQERALQQRAHLHANGTNLDIPGSGVQRTPLVTSNNGGLGFSVQESQRRSAFNRQLFGFNNNHGGDRSAGLSERSNSVNEVENFLLSGPQPRASNSSRNLASNWSFGGQGQQQNQRGTAGISASATKRGFRPAIGR